MIDLGEYHHCLNVQDLEQSLAFYQKLGFAIIEDHRDEQWTVLKHNNMVLALYQGHIERNLINFRGGDIDTIAHELAAQELDFSMPAAEHPDGSWSAEVVDPDGNRIFFNTYPDEREQYVRTGKLIEDS